MLVVDFMENGLLRVVQHIHSFTETQTSHHYYDLEKKLKSYIGKENEIPSLPMTESEIKWVQDHYVPMVKKRQEERDVAAIAALRDPFSVDPERFEKARRWATLITASMITEGLYDTLSRNEIRTERAARYEVLRAEMRMPTDREFAQANRIIAERDAPCVQEAMEQPRG